MMERYTRPRPNGQKRKRLAALTTGVLGLALVCGTPGVLYAQAQAEPAPAEQAQEPAQAGEPVQELEEVVTFGERRHRSVSDEASSVSLLTSEDIQNLAGPDEIRTILKLTPNVQVENGSDRGPTFRGYDSTGVFLSIDALSSGARPRATAIEDGRAMSFSEYIFGPLSLWDVDTVEVFQGPQTTTRGPNTIAGAVVVKTKDPTYDYKAAVRGLGGNYDTYQGSAMVSGPIIADQLAVRATVDYQDTDTFMKLTNKPNVGADLEEDGHLQVRTKLLFEPKAIPNFKAKMTYSRNSTTRPVAEVVDRPFVSRRRNYGGGESDLLHTPEDPYDHCRLGICSERVYPLPPVCLHRPDAQALGPR